jgi:hypothetical protein
MTNSPLFRHGPAWHLLRWTYARWIQVLAHLDALGADGRPSQSKIVSYAALIYGALAVSDTVVIIALCAGFGKSMLLAAICSWRGTTASVRTTVEATTRQIIERRDASQGIDPAGRVPEPLGD